MADRIQQRRDTAARWAQFNPILLEGEVGYVLDNPNHYKIGDGVKAWNDLPLRGYDGNVVDTEGEATNAVMNQLATTDIALQYTPFTAVGSTKTVSDNPLDAGNRKLWADFFKAIEIPQEALNALMADFTDKDNPYPTPTTFWSFAEGDWSTTAFNVNLYRNDGGWKQPRLNVSFSKSAAIAASADGAGKGWVTMAAWAALVGSSTTTWSGQIYITINLDAWPTGQVVNLSNMTLSSRVRPEIFQRDYYPSIREWKIATQLNTKINETTFVKRQLGGSGTMTYDWLKKILIGATVTPQWNWDDTKYISPAQILISNERLSIDFYEVKESDGNWGQTFTINIDNLAEILANDNNKILKARPMGGNGGVAYFNVQEIKNFLAATGGIPSKQSGYKFELDKAMMKEGGDAKSIAYNITPGSYQRPFLYKNTDQRRYSYPEIFVEAFYDIKLNIDPEPDTHYGWCYVRYNYDTEGNCTEAYFENYSWKFNEETGSPMFTSMGDSFIIPISVIDAGDKLSYYKSPNGKFEMLVNWYRFFALRDKWTTQAVFFGSFTGYEFADIVTDKSAMTPLNLYRILGVGVGLVQYDTTTQKILNGYPDNQMTRASMLQTYDYLADMNINGNGFFSYGVWGRVDSTGLIERVEALAPQNQATQVECVVKVFDGEPASGLDLWSDQYGTRIGGKVIDPAVDIKNNILTIETDQVIVKAGQVVILFIQPVDTTVAGSARVGTIFYSGNSWENIPNGTYFYWKSTYQTPTYSKSSIGTPGGSTNYAYYQIPLKIYSKFPLEKRVSSLEKEVETLKNNIGTQDPRLVIPKRLYAIVGKEFNLYYDAFTLLPEVGTNQNNVLFDIVCSIGTSIEKCFRVTPTADQVGDYPMTISILDTFGKVQYSASTILTVVPAENPSTEKRILMIGDSTTDDTGQVVIGLNNNLNDLTGGVKPLLVGHKTYYQRDEIKHGAATGKTLSFYANGATVLKFNIASGVPAGAGNYPNLTLRSPDDTGYVVNIETTNNGDGSGSIVANVWTGGSSPIGAGFTGQLKTNGQAGWPSTIEVASTEQLNAWSPVRFDGAIDFVKYAAHIGLTGDQKIDLFSIDLGINDSRGTVQSEATQMNKINAAIALADAFHAYNPNGKVMFCLPKSCAAPRSRSNANHDTYRMNIQRMRELYLQYFDNNSDRPYCYVCNSGLSIDRFWGYSITTVPAAARYPSNTVTVNVEDVHPRTEGYYQVADAMVGCMIYLLTH